MVANIIGKVVEGDANNANVEDIDEGTKGFT